MPDCPHCGSAVPPGSRFCPECGRRLGEPEQVAARRLPFDASLLVVAAITLAALVLAARREWASALVALLLAALVFLSRRELERQKAVRALGALRARAASAGEVFAARSREQMELFRARRELAELEAERSRRLRELGEAAFDRDEARTEAAREAVAALLDRIREKEAEIATWRRETERRIEGARLEAMPTERLDVGSGGSAEKREGAA